MEKAFLVVLLWALISHWVADFIFQKDEDAKTKGKSLKHLTNHIKGYAIVFSLLILAPLHALLSYTTTNYYLLILTFLAINIITHFGIDYATSKITSKFWAEGRVHEFFVIVGLDQLLHTTIIVLSLYYVYPY